MGMTGYLNKRLKRTGERIVYRTHLSWIPMFLSAIPMIWLVSIIAGAVMGFTGNWGYTLMAFLLGFILILISMIPKILRNLGTDIVVTDRRLHTKTGILDVDNDKQTPLTNIDDTVADPTVLGRLFGYGDVVVHTFGGREADDNFPFRNVTDPHELVAVINETRDGLVAGNQNPYMSFQESQERRRNENGNRTTISFS
jgi:membrane protein YdbS with pleckstrin-like domain